MIFVEGWSAYLQIQGPTIFDGPFILRAAPNFSGKRTYFNLVSYGLS